MREFSCIGSRLSFVQISIAVELLIFSCRTPGLFFLDMPSWGLIIGVMGANIIVSLCAVYNIVVTPHIPWQWVGNIWAYNLLWLVFIDLCKLLANYMMGNLSTDVLDYVDLPEEPSDAVGIRLSAVSSVHQRDSAMARSSVTYARPSVIAANITRPSAMRRSGASHAPTSESSATGALRASYAPKSGSLRPSTPGNVAIHGPYHPDQHIATTNALRESLASIH